MRADRLLTIVMLLQARGRLTARQLSQELEVSPRTIHRDMDALSAAGIPVVAERGPSGGWALLDDYRTTLTGLTAAERQMLFVDTHPELLARLGLERVAETARLKLLAALPAAARRDAEYAQQRLYVDPSGWRRSTEEVPCLPALQAAVWEDRRAQIVYQRGDGEVVERVIDPLGLVAKGQLWYLVAAVEGQTRTYRVARVSAIRVLDEPVTRPAGFDLVAYWRESSETFQERLPRYRAKLRVHPDILAHVRTPIGWGRLDEIGPTDDDGWTTVTVTFQVIDEACAYVFRFGPHIEALEPAELRALVLERAHSVQALHDQGRKTAPL